MKRTTLALAALTFVSTGAQAFEDYELRKNMEALSAQRWMCETQKNNPAKLPQCEEALEYLLVENKRLFDRALNARRKLIDSVLTPEDKKEQEQETMAWVADNRKCRESGTAPEQCEKQSSAGLDRMLKANRRRVNERLPEEYKDKPVLAIDQIRGSGASAESLSDTYSRMLRDSAGVSAREQQERHHNETMRQMQQQHSERQYQLQQNETNRMIDNQRLRLEQHYNQQRY